MENPASSDLANFLNSAIARISALEQQLQHSQSVITQLQSISPSPANTAATKILEPKVPLPEKFSGKRSTLRDFLTSVDSVFALQASRFPDDKTKILFVSTLLVDGPLAWFRTLKATSSNAELFNDYQVFIKALTAAFGDPNAQKNAQRALQTLIQGKRSVNAYATEFRRFAVDSGFDVVALIALFHRGLNNEIKDRLSYIENLPSDLDKFVDLCIKLDSRVQELRHEKQAFPGFSHRPPFANITPRAPEVASHVPTPMEIDAVTKVQNSISKHQPLTKEQREFRQKNNLCLYCGESGHFRSSCHKRPQKKDKKAFAVTASSFDSKEQGKF